MEETLQTPIKPINTTLQAHITALDLLSSRLASLPQRTRWPVRVPINSKASFKGSIVHTNDVKVHLGEEWWVEMTADEAREYVERRKRVILEDQARKLDGQPSRSENIASDAAVGEKRTLLPAESILFNPMFASPATAGPSRRISPLVQTPQPSPPTPAATPSNPKKEIASALNAQTAKGKALQQLVDLVGSQIEEKLHLKDGAASGKGKGKGVEVSDESTVLNDEGLPFHEIRETEDGVSLDPIPEETDAVGPSITIEAAESDYWAPEAVARREELKRRLFNDGIPSSDDEDEDEEPEVSQKSHSTMSSSPSSEAASPETMISRPSLTPTTSQTEATPKSILKSPSRKKSVSFDSSVPIPSSPPATTKKLGFPLPGIDMESEFQTKAVPTIIVPKPSGKIQEKGFGGFKRGFLDSASKSSTVAASVPTPVPAPMPAPAKKTSLFAQRLAQQANSLPPPNQASPTVVTPAPLTQPSTKMSLPKLSESKPMASMKTSVVEKQPSTSRSPSSTMAAVSTPSQPPIKPQQALHPSSAESQSQNEYDEYDDEGSDDSYGDLGDFSEGEEDEYDLDEALLAREVALEYHKRRQFHLPPTESSDWVPADEDESTRGGGDVIMGLPTIADIHGNIIPSPRIVDPTPEDLAQFVRVGKLENGNLVLAEGGAHEFESDDEDDEDGDEVDAAVKDERRRRREEVRRLLVEGKNEEGVIDLRETPVQKALMRERERDIIRNSLPPTIKTVTEVRKEITEGSSLGTSSNPPIVGITQPAPVSSIVKEVISPSSATPPEPPKKVSRFKQARQAASGN